MKRHRICALIAVLVLAVPVAYGDVLMDHLNDPGMAVWYGITGDVTAWAFDADNPLGAGTSARIQYPGNVTWWGALQGEYASSLNLAAETHIRFWAKATGTNVRITLHLITGSWGAGASKAEVTVGATWTQYEIPIASFVVDNWYNSPTGENTVPVNWSAVGTFQYQVFSENAATAWLDHIEAIGVSGPLVSTVVPAKESILDHYSPTTISVTFNKSVTGVAAGNLTVAGNPATAVTGSGAGPYVFSGYAQPSPGTANVLLSSGTITDGTELFQGDRWRYTIVTRLSATAYFTSAPITIDGTLGPGEWPPASAQTFTSSLGTISGPTDFSSTFYVLHDANYLYIAVSVTDDEIAPTSGTRPWWQEDCAEIFVDSDHSQDVGNVDQSLGHIGQVGVSWDRASTGGQTSMGPPGPGRNWNVECSRPSVNNYIMEFIIRKAAGNVPSSGTTVGFNVQIQDRDANTPQQARLWWFGAIDNDPWDNEYGWGDLILSSEPAPPGSLGVRGRLWTLFE